MLTYSKERMDSERNNPYAGIFREEVTQQLLTSCMSVVNNCLRPLHIQCERKIDGEQVFERCVDLIRTGWTEEEFSREVEDLGATFDPQFRGTFIIFVRQTFVDPTGASTRQVRLTVPPTVAFVREYLRAISQDQDLRSGKFFRDCSRLDQKDMVMEAIRAALQTLAREFVHTEESHASAEDTDTGEKEAEALEEEEEEFDDDDVTPDDSVSSCGRQKVEEKSAISVELNHRARDHRRDEEAVSKAPRSESSASRSRHSSHSSRTTSRAASKSER